MKYSLPWVLLLSVAAAPAQAEEPAWGYQRGRGYVNLRTGQVCADSDAFFERGTGLVSRASTREALAVFGAMLKYDPDEAMREKACFMIGRAWWAAGKYEPACRGYDLFLRKFPRSARAGEAKEQAMWCALQYSRAGEETYILGIPSGRSGKRGREMLRVLLKRYPREAFSARYALLLARLLVEQEEPEEAEGEYLRVVDRYTDGENARYAGLALMDLVRLQKSRFDGLDYDIAPIREARRYCQQFLDTPLIRESDPALTEKVREEALELDELLARKLVLIAEYYESRGYPESARVYLRTVLKFYPDTKQAAASRALLKEAGEAPEGKAAPSGS